MGARANAGQGAGIRRPSADQFGAVVGFRSARCLGYKLERAETALRAALAERDDYLRQLAVALGERDELRRQRDHFRAELDRLTSGGRLESA